MEQPPSTAPNNQAELATTGSTDSPLSTGDQKLAVIDRFLDLQSQELQVRQREADLEEKNQQRAYDYSTHVLSAQERDRAHDRDHNRKSAREKMLGVCILVLIVLSASIVSMSMGNREFALDLLKYFGTFTAGGAFGFGIKSSISDTKKKQGAES